MGRAAQRGFTCDKRLWSLLSFAGGPALCSALGIFSTNRGKEEREEEITSFLVKRAERPGGGAGDAEGFGSEHRPCCFAEKGPRCVGLVALLCPDHPRADRTHPGLWAQGTAARPSSTRGTGAVPGPCRAGTASRGCCTTPGLYLCHAKAVLRVLCLQPAVTAARAQPRTDQIRHQHCHSPGSHGLGAWQGLSAPSANPLWASPHQGAFAATICTPSSRPVITQ